MQIDWISAVVTSRQFCLNGVKLYDTGRLITLDRDGVVASQKPAFFTHEGSHDTRIAITSLDGTSLYLSGNPCKFFQGHNLFGSDDASGLLFEAGHHIRRKVGLFPGPETYRANAYEPPRFTRLDVTRSYRFPSDQIARDWLRTAASFRSRHGGALSTGTTVYLGKNSERWSLKMYLKSDELKARGKAHKLSAALAQADRDELTDWATGVVRFELTLRSKELEKLDTFNATAVWHSYWGKLTMNRNALPQEPDITVEALPLHLAGHLALWRDGVDLRRVMTKTTFYRVRSQLLAAVGVDISTPPPPVPVSAGPQLAPEGWDPEPIKRHLFLPSAALKRQYGVS